MHNWFPNQFVLCHFWCNYWQYVFFLKNQFSNEINTIATHYKLLILFQSGDATLYSNQKPPCKRSDLKQRSLFLIWGTCPFTLVHLQHPGWQGRQSRELADGWLVSLKSSPWKWGASLSLNISLMDANQMVTLSSRGAKNCNPTTCPGELEIFGGQN